MNPKILTAVKGLVAACEGFLHNDDGNDDPHIIAMGRSVEDVKRQLESLIDQEA